ncbi:MAG: ATPase, T2SS/T4P/T4SS family [Thermodesulfobacteriota bacterium]
MATNLKVIPFPVREDEQEMRSANVKNGSGNVGSAEGLNTGIITTAAPAAAAAGKPRAFKLGEYLLQAGLIDSDTLGKALALQKKNGKKLGETLIEMQVADEAIVARYLARQLKIPFVRLDGVRINPDIIKLIPVSVAARHTLIPVKRAGQELYVALEDPKNITALDDARFAAEMKVLPVCAPKGEILRSIALHYGETAQGKQKGSSLAARGDFEILHDAPSEAMEKDVDELLKKSCQSPVITAVDAIVYEAIRRNASDIHIEPLESGVVVRCRVDGLLTEVSRLDSSLQAGVVSRIKIVSKMDIAERRKPQDGKVQVRFEGKTFDLRVSTIPTANGEKVVIRILAQHKGAILMEDMNFPVPVYMSLSRSIEKTAGIILATGPTGSGKSTTLYACLNRVKSPEVNIITVEDPVEYKMEGINQVPINPKAGLTFASALRSILRQDPDIIMVGEIRDPETAAIAVEAAQTGHLVLSTLHTNDAPSAVARLADLGVEQYLIASALEAVLAQRLVRRICPRCGAPDPDAVAHLSRFPRRYAEQVRTANFMKGLGCDYCGGTGYAGRMGIYELVQGGPGVREAISRSASADSVAAAAAKEGYIPMALDGLAKAASGLTTLSEVLRVAVTDSSAGKFATDDSTLSFAVPLAAGAQEEGQNSEKRSTRVLVADDSATMRRLISSILAKQGYEVITASNGLDALQAALRDQPDMMVTDHLMPDMDGVTLIRKLRSQMGVRKLPIVMLSAKEEDRFRQEAISAGADRFLKKPLDAVQLLGMVRDLLGPLPEALPTP